MQFKKNTSFGASNFFLKLTIKIAVVFLLFFILIILIGRIEFPSPNKKIEKIISNEELKIIK